MRCRTWPRGRAERARGSPYLEVGQGAQRAEERHRLPGSRRAAQHHRLVFSKPRVEEGLVPHGVDGGDDDVGGGHLVGLHLHLGHARRPRHPVALQRCLEDTEGGARGEVQRGGQSTVSMVGMTTSGEATLWVSTSTWGTRDDHGTQSPCRDACDTGGQGVRGRAGGKGVRIQGRTRHPVVLQQGARGDSSGNTAAGNEVHDYATVGTGLTCAAVSAGVLVLYYKYVINETTTNRWYLIWSQDMTCMLHFTANP